MRKVLLLAWLLSLPAFGQFGNATKLRNLNIKAGLACSSDAFIVVWVAANSQFECLTNLPSTGQAIPVWTKCTVTNSGANLVVSGTGCNAASTAKAAGLTQSISLFTLPANGYISAYRLKSSTAFAGTTALTSGIGTTSSPNLFLVSATGYNLKAAVSATNITTALPLIVGADTTASVDAVLSLTSTVDNLSSISAGVVDAWVLWSVLQ